MILEMRFLRNMRIKKEKTLLFPWQRSKEKDTVLYAEKKCQYMMLTYKRQAVKNQFVKNVCKKH